MSHKDIKNDGITVLRQDKGRGVVILNKPDYIKKCETFLHGKEFRKLENDPTGSFQTKVQNILRKMKKKFTKEEYRRVYPSSSQLGLFFGLAKTHKIKTAEKKVEDLPLTLSWGASSMYVGWGGVGKFTHPYYLPNYNSNCHQTWPFGSMSEEDQKLSMTF